ncbi:AAA family ATPase [Mycena floridula]|nr:AAA family ATPase [Mycena floridula]
MSRQFSVNVSDGNHCSRRVVFNAETLKNLKLTTGDVVALTNSVQQFAVGVVWPALELSPTTISISSSLQLTAGLQVGAQASIFPLSATKAPPPGIPSLKDIKQAASIKLKNCVARPAEKKPRDWLPLLLRESLVDLKYITQNQILQVIYDGETRQFAVDSIAGSNEDSLSQNLNNLSLSTTPQLWIVGWDVLVSIVDDERIISKPKIEQLGQIGAEDAYASVGGLNKQITEIRDLLDIPLTRPELFRHFGLKPPRGILLHGPPGTGKTHLARAIASSTRSSVLVINGPELSSAYHGETEAKLREVFREAREKSPCIVVLDEVDALVPRREDGAGGEVEKRVVATLLTLLDGMEDESDQGTGRVVVIGTTNRPNAIDPALRRPGRFDREFEIGVPDTEARFSILQVLLSKTPHSITDEELSSLASRAHGYVGADLSAVVREAGTIAIKRWLASHPDGSSSSAAQLTLALPDMVASLPSVRPSAMRSLFVDSPPVRYSDIGGQSHVIKKLREAVEWPLLHPETFRRLGVKPPKGILLYGPPGCSKTVMARACACESGVNFLAVKGPELLNKFVGESERAVREIFRKARAASPSIIFFDEIDALATSRSSSDGDTGSSHEGVLTSLLNEMDGVQELLGVTVIAATNRPDAIDSALMRSGRLDRILYVGPPDSQGREEILRIRMRTMQVEASIDLGEIAALTEGCSGAEMSALCQEAALLTMQKDMNAPYVPKSAFVTAAKAMPRHITPTMIQKFERWRVESGAQSV